MSYRELWVLISKLPQDSWTQTALRDDPARAELPTRAESDEGPTQFGPWALTNYQLAALTDAVRDLAWLTQAIATPQNGQPPPRPHPTPRPGARPDKVRAITPGQVSYLNKLRARKEE